MRLQSLVIATHEAATAPAHAPSRMPDVPYTAVTVPAIQVRVYAHKASAPLDAAAADPRNKNPQPAPGSMDADSIRPCLTPRQDPYWRVSGGGRAE
ncbi:hypothetical protein BDV11DRAFT_189314 [Aspergillus similis]